MRERGLINEPAIKTLVSVFLCIDILAVMSIASLDHPMRRNWCCTCAARAVRHAQTGAGAGGLVRRSPAAVSSGTDFRPRRRGRVVRRYALTDLGRAGPADPQDLASMADHAALSGAG